MLSFDLLAIFTTKCNDSVSFSFLFPCFHFSSLSVLCVYLFHCVTATEFELQPVQSTACS